MSEQHQVPPIYEEETETEEQKEKKQRLKTLFSDLESKQPDFLDEAGKSIIERIATFLAILFAVTALGSSFPPKYLVGNPRDKYLVIAILICYLLAMGIAMWGIHPRNYGLYVYSYWTWWIIRTTSANPLWTGFFVIGQSGRTSHPGVKPHPTSSDGIFTNFFAT